MGALLPVLIALGLAAAPRPSAPVITGNLGPSAATAHSYTFASIEGGVATARLRYRCSLDRPALRACPRKVTFRFTPGTHVLRAQAVDPAGRASAVSRATIVVQAVVPQLTLEQDWQVDVSGGTGVEQYGDISVSPTGELVMGDPPHDRILVYGAGGVFRRTWGSHGDGAGQFDFARATDEPPDVQFASTAIDPRSGDVYVAETQRVQRFDAQGHYELGWGTTGAGDGQFTRVIGLAVSSGGTVYALEDRPVATRSTSPTPTTDGSWRSTTSRGRRPAAGRRGHDPTGWRVTVRGRST